MMNGHLTYGLGRFGKNHHRRWKRAFGLVWICYSLWLGQVQAQTTDMPSTHPMTEVPAKKISSSVADKLAIVPIHREIDDVTTVSLERRCESAVADGVNIIVFELNTPGGLVSSAVEITKYIRSLSDRGVKTVAWVRDEAISGGTMIAMACDEILMSNYSLLGDCGVIMMGPGGPETAQDPALDAKIESYVLSIFDSAAKRNGYDPLLCESFVRYEIEVWWVENKTTGERRFVSADEKKELFNETTASTSQPATMEWQLVKTYVDPFDRTEKSLRQPVESATKLLTMDQSMAQVLGFSKAMVRDERELQDYYGVSIDQSMARYERNWSENLVTWLTSPMVRMVLIALIGLGAYTEFHSPGVGLPGLVALIALAIFLGAPYLTGLANMWEIVVVLLGIALVMVEILLMPGLGIPGIAGVILIIIGLLATFMPEEPLQPLPFYWPELPQSFEGLKRGVIVLAGGMAGTLVGMWALSRYAARIPLFNKLAPAGPATDLSSDENMNEDVAFVGAVGLSETPLRPAGKVRFGTMLVDVVTQGDMIESHERVEVLERHGNRIVVRKAI